MRTEVNNSSVESVTRTWIPPKWAECAMSSCVPLDDNCPACFALYTDLSIARISDQMLEEMGFPRSRYHNVILHSRSTYSLEVRTPYSIIVLHPSEEGIDLLETAIEWNNETAEIIEGKLMAKNLTDYYEETDFPVCKNGQLIHLPYLVKFDKLIKGKMPREYTHARTNTLPVLWRPGILVRSSNANQ